MSLGNQQIKNIYAISTTVIIVIILLLAVAAYKSEKRYEDNKLIAIKTSRGLIKMNAKKIAEHLSNLRAELSRHNEPARTDKYDIQVQDLIDHIKLFIDKNPHNKDVRKCEIKAHIIDTTLQDRAKSSFAHDTVMSHSDDSSKFDELLNHVDILVKMLNHNVCDSGLIDVATMETILAQLEGELTKNVEFDKDSAVDLHMAEDLSNEFVARYNPYIIPQLSLFESQVSQIEGLKVETPARNSHVLAKAQYSIGPQHVRNAQQRSQLFRDNAAKLGLKHYVDEDLLLNSTYASYAL